MSPGAFILLALGAAGVEQQPGRQTPTFGAQVTSIFIDVFATNDDRMIPGLRAQDFVLRDDGIPRRFELVPADSLPIRLILAFDTSFSVKGPKLERLQSAALTLLGGLRSQDEAGLIVFSEEVAWPAPLSSDHERVRNAIRGLRASGATAVYDGLLSALLMPQSAMRTLVVLFSDGEDNTSWIDDARMRKLVERFNALIYVVAVRSEDFRSGFQKGDARVEATYVKSLRTIAEITGGSLIVVDSADTIAAAFAEIMERMKSRYVLRYEPEDDPTPGWHRLDVTLKSKKGKVRGRTGYWVASK